MEFTVSQLPSYWIQKSIDSTFKIAEMVEFATVFVISTFIVGSSFCCLALWTIQKSPALRESFGVLCKFQMLTDLTLLTVTSVYSLIPVDYAPPENSLTAITITYVAEISYHYSGAMHDLFAINRFVYIVFPSTQKMWRRATPKILIACAIVIAFHTIIMTILGLLLLQCTLLLPCIVFLPAHKHLREGETLREGLNTETGD